MSPFACVMLFAAAPAGDAVPDWAHDVAPLVHRRCAPCHHDGTAAPFPLLRYADARAHAQQMARVTERRRMPPWLPADGDVPFADDRRLTPAEIALLAQWAENGAPEGDPAAAPTPPEFPVGWQLGEPDLVLQPPETFTLRADGGDVFRNLVLPVDLPDGKYVLSCEMRPGSGRFVHHAVIFLDPFKEGRRLDRLEPDAGFGGMDLHSATSPDGHFVGWAPGRTPAAVGDGMQWKLPARADLLIQLHLLPSGKPEAVLPQVGLRFTSEPPTRLPCIVRIGSRTLDIAPGDANYVVEDSLELPVDSDALVIVPHAHFLGKHLEGFAVLPDGKRVELLDIPQWDFTWQDEYRFAHPVALPKGTRVAMRYTFDNSAENPRNPSHPPHRIVYGPNSTDEMSDLWLQLLPRNAADRDALNAAMERKNLDDRVVMMRLALERGPPDAANHYNFGTALFMAGRFDEAGREFEQVLALDPSFVSAHVNLGLVKTRAEDWAGARACFEKALALDPKHGNVHKNLALACTRQGDWKAAAAAWRALLAVERDPRAAQFLAWILATAPDDAARNGADALTWAKRAVQQLPQDAAALDVLAAAYAELGRFKDAILTAKEAIELAQKAEQPELAKAYLERQSAYRERRPWRDTVAPKK